MTRRRTLIVLVGALALLPAACDSGDSESTGEPAGSAKPADFIARMDHLCGATNAALSQLNGRLQSLDPSDPAQFRKAVVLFKRAVRKERATVAEMGDLVPPADMRATTERLLAAYESEVDLVEQVRQALERKDAAAIDALKKQQATAKAKAYGIAKGLGLRVCGTGGGG